MEVRGFIENNKLFIVLVIITIILIIGSSFAYYSLTIRANNLNVLKAGTLSLVLDDKDVNGIMLDNSIPITDEVGLASDGYTFKLKNTGDIDSDYTIYFDDINLSNDENRMNDKYLKYSLTRNGITMETDYLSNTGINPNRILESNTIPTDTTYIYNLKIWIDNKADNGVMGTTFKEKLRIEANQKHDLSTDNNS